MSQRDARCPRSGPHRVQAATGIRLALVLGLIASVRPPCPADAAPVVPRGQVRTPDANHRIPGIQGAFDCLDPTDPGLVAWYGFDLPGYIGQENSVHGLHGGGPAGVVKGMCNSGLRFQPNNNLQEFSVGDDDLLDITGAMTGMAWVRPWGPQSTDNNPGCAEGTIFAKGGNYWFQVGHNNDQLVFQNDGGSPGGYAATAVSLPIGIWSHVAFVRSAGANNVKFYVNGQQVGASAGYTLTVGPSANSSPLMLGNYGFGNSPADCELNGDLDEVRLYSRILSETEIDDIYKCQCPGDEGPCPIVASLEINTGYDQLGQGVKAIGLPDNEWLVVTDPVPGTTEPRPAFVIAQHPTGWHDPLDDSQWISAYPNSADLTDNHYIFEYTFCLQNTSGASLSLMLLADDRADVFLNNVLIGSTPAVGFTTPTTINVATGFLAGTNSLRIDVENTDGVAMGLNVAGTIVGNVPQYSYCCSPLNSGLAGTVWNDANGNGTRDAGEPPLSGRTVSLSNGQTRISDNLGNYYFMGLPAGFYTINQTPFSGWIKTAPPSGTYFLGLPPAEFVANFDFGNQVSQSVNCNLPASPIPPLSKGGRRVILTEVNNCCEPEGAEVARFGGTIWAADSLRWEAVLDGEWTFDTGVGSSINGGANPGKPIGYHQTMNGWFGLDLSAGTNPGYFRRRGECPINGFFSMTAA